MKNCLGDHTHMCVFNDRHIIRVDGPGVGQHGVMAVEERKTDNGKMQVVLLGSTLVERPKNKAPGPWLIDAAKWVIDGINDGVISVDWSGHQSERSEMRKNLSLRQVEIKIGFDPFCPSYVEEAYRTWHHMNRELFPWPDYESFVAESGIMDVIIEHCRDMDRTRPKPGKQKDLQRMILGLKP